MKFKIERRDGTVIYANDICINGGCLQTVAVWSGGKAIDSMDLADINFIWALYPDRDIAIFL